MRSCLHLCCTWQPLILLVYQLPLGSIDRYSYITEPMIEDIIALKVIIMQKSLLPLRKDHVLRSNKENLLLEPDWMWSQEVPPLELARTEQNDEHFIKGKVRVEHLDEPMVLKLLADCLWSAFLITDSMPDNANRDENMMKVDHIKWYDTWRYNVSQTNVS